jgi:hypothetical protein
MLNKKLLETQPLRHKRLHSFLGGGENHDQLPHYMKNTKESDNQVHSNHFQTIKRAVEHQQMTREQANQLIMQRQRHLNEVTVKAVRKAAKNTETKEIMELIRRENQHKKEEGRSPLAVSASRVASMS